MSAGGSQRLCSHYFPTSSTPVSVCLVGPIWYVLSNTPHLFGGGGPNLFYVLANAPRLLCLPGGSHPVLCSPMHLVCWTGPNLFMCSPMHHVCVSVYRVQSGMCSLMHHFWLDEAQICFLCSLMHLVFVSAWRVSTYFVLTNAPRLLDWPKSVSCAHQCTTSECLSTGSNLVCAQ